MPKHDGHLRNYSKPRKAIAEVWRLDKDRSYLKKSVRRLAVLQDVPVLTNPAEIREALGRWRHVLYPIQVKALEQWLAGQ